MSTVLCEATPRSVTDLKKDVFDALFDAHYRDVLRFIERRVDDDHAAQDLAADVFALLWSKLDPADPVGRAWLYRAASHLIANHYRRRDRRRLAERAIVTVADRPESSVDDRLAVAAAMRALNDRERQIVQLTYWEGLSAEEIGVVLGIGAPVVWTALSRARTKLRGLLEHTGEEGP